jgi:hypothetical protein
VFHAHLGPTRTPQDRGARSVVLGTPRIVRSLLGVTCSTVEAATMRSSGCRSRRAAFTLLFVVAACGNSGSPDTPKAIATSSTTAEEARPIDGPVMRYQERSSTSAKLPNLLEGVLQLDGNCLYLVQSAIEQRFPILWPADTRWDGGNQSVVSPVGEVMRIGGTVEGRGGYFYLSDIGLLAGLAARNLAAECVENGQIAVAENNGTAIGPKNT